MIVLSWITVTKVATQELKDTRPFQETKDSLVYIVMT
jgi:hypothetical protein